MGEWRFGRGWNEAELADRLRRLEGLERNFTADADMLTAEHGWHGYASEARLTTERVGPPVPDGQFERGWVAMRAFRFSDPDIVTAHFDPAVPLLGRRMLLEVKVLGLRYLNGALVSAVRTETIDERTEYGFRYDTLEGHIERGAEWFVLTKDHTTGAVRFSIRARWRPGDFPNWWSHLGFHFVAPRYQRKWHRRAHARLQALMREPHVALAPRGGRLAHEGPDVVFTFERGMQP